MIGDRAMSDSSRPFRERVRHLRDAWVQEGRDRAHLVTGRTFFAVYCWSLNYKISDPTAPMYDAELTEFVAASYELNGGADGWNTMLNSREICSTCGDWYRLENLGTCTGCMRYTCYGCGHHKRCTGELL